MSEGIIAYSWDDRIAECIIDSFEPVIKELESFQRALFDCPDVIIIEIFVKFGKEIIRDPSLADIPGLSYLSLWLRRDHLNAIYQANFGSCPENRGYIPIDSRIEMCRVPRGVVCHWIAGNISLLGFFSLVLATMGKNASILKIHPRVNRILCLLLQKLDMVTVDTNDISYSGKIVTQAVRLVSFPGSNEEISSAFSLSADCRVIYGSNEAVSAISSIPHQVHADTIVYGPKYSIGIFANDAIGSPGFKKMLEGMAMDIVLYNQTACSSPHTIFFEKNSLSLYNVAKLLKKSLNSLPERYFLPLDEGTAISVINNRSDYLLDDTKDILLSDDLKWTICMNNTLSMEEPVQGRCVFVKEIDNINQVLPLISKKIQTVALSIQNRSRREEYIRELAYRGVDRVMTPGTMHEFTQPWDGILGAGRMVRWIAIKKE